MRVFKITVILVLALLFSSISTVLYADELAIRYSILSAESNGIAVKGTIRVEVQNLSNSNVKNVDLRLAHSGPYSIEKGLFQFGGIPAAGAKVVTGSYLFDEASIASGALLLWRVDYDTGAGLHQQVIVPGVQVGQ